jgi:hypothetical protein
MSTIPVVRPLVWSHPNTNSVAWSQEVSVVELEPIMPYWLLPYAYHLRESLLLMNQPFWDTLGMRSICPPSGRRSGMRFDLLVWYTSLPNATSTALVEAVATAVCIPGIPSTFVPSRMLNPQQDTMPS